MDSIDLVKTELLSSHTMNKLKEYLVSFILIKLLQSKFHLKN